MVKNCCVLGCTSNTKRNPAISFFRFPTDVTLASMWLQLIGRPDFKPSQYSVICQLHFTRDDFTSGSHHYPITGIGGQRKRLKTKAIPTQNLNGCTNPEVLAEIQMRAKTTFPQQKLTKSMMSNANTMVNANTLQNNSNNEAAQLQQLLTSLMPALFGNDNSSNQNTNNNPNKMDTGTNNVTSSANSLTSGLSTPQGSFTSSPQGGYTNGISTPPFSSAASPPSVAPTQGPIISLPSSLQNISLAESTVQCSGTLFSSSALSAEPIMSTPILKKEPVTSTDHAIFKISNGSSLPSHLHSTSVLSSNHLHSNHLPSNQPSNQSSNGTAVIRTNGPTPSTEDLYTELQNSLLALKQNFSSDSTHIVKNQSPSLVQVQQPIAHEIPMETGNNAYIIDVDTYQKLMETVSQKSEKSIQTEQDITICSLQSEIKQLKDQLCQYELAFNSLINWTEGSLKTDPVPQAPAPSESKLIEGTLIE